MRLSNLLPGARARKRSAAAWVAAREGEGLDPRRFNAWRRAHRDNGDEYARLTDLWEDPALTEALRAVERRTARSRPKLRRGALLPAGLAAAAAAITLPLAWPALELAQAPVLEHRTQPGQRLTVPLEDGSVVDMAGDTWVRIRQTPHRRQVELLRGEAFFDVAHAEDRPFQVLTDDSRVQVVGTRFDVNRTASGTELAVERGKVRFGPRRLLAESRLIEGGLTTALTTAGPTPVQRLESGSAGDWREGWIETHGMSVERLVEEMGRWSPTPIRVADPALGTMTVAGRFRVTSPERTLSNLARLHGFTLQREHGAIVLRRHATDSKAS